MTLRQRYTYPEHVLDLPWITPGEAAMLDRLALKAQATAIEFGIDLTWDEAITRAKHNLAFVRALGGARR